MGRRKHKEKHDCSIRGTFFAYAACLQVSVVDEAEV